MDKNNRLYEIVSFSITNKGNVRQANEDNHFISSDNKFYVVADGMGGHDKGEDASRIVCEGANKAYNKMIKDYSIEVERGVNFLDADNCLDTTIMNAHFEMRMLHKDDSLFPKNTKPGSTFTGAIIDDESELHYTSLGDSRLYLFRRGKLEQLTEDDNIIKRLRKKGIELTKEKADNHPLKNQIDQYISANFSFAHEVEPVTVEVQEENDTEETILWDDDEILNPPKFLTIVGEKETPYLPPQIKLLEEQSQQDFVYDYKIDSITLQKGDTLLFCSDGLTDLVDNNEIEEIITRYISGKEIVSENDLSECSNNLIDLALRRGGHDNITILLSNLNEYIPSMENIISQQKELMEKQNSTNYDPTDVPKINIEPHTSGINLLDSTNKRDKKKDKKEKKNLLEKMLGFFGEEITEPVIIIDREKGTYTVEDKYLEIHQRYDTLGDEHRELVEEYNLLKESYKEIKESMDKSLNERKTFVRSIKDLSSNKEDLEEVNKKLEERCLESDKDNRKLRDNIRSRIKETFESQRDYIDMKKGASNLIKKEKRKSNLYGMLAGSFLGAAVTFSSPVVFNSIYNIYENINNQVSTMFSGDDREVIDEEELKSINSYLSEINIFPRRIVVDGENCSQIMSDFEIVNSDFQREISNDETFLSAKKNMEEFINKNCKD